jgi:hypothetical protein
MSLELNLNTKPTMNSGLLKRARGGDATTSGRTRQIVSLLKTLGVPNQLLYVRGGQRKASLWLRPINHLHVLEQARSLYRMQIVSVHPDRGGGNLVRTIELNQSWHYIQKRFREHGHELG